MAFKPKARVTINLGGKGKKVRAKVTTFTCPTCGKGVNPGHTCVRRASRTARQMRGGR